MHAAHKSPAAALAPKARRQNSENQRVFRFAQPNEPIQYDM